MTSCCELTEVKKQLKGTLSNTLFDFQGFILLWKVEKSVTAICIVVKKWEEKELTSNFLKLNAQKVRNYRARWLRGNVRDSHSRGPGFKSRGRPTWLRFLVVSSIKKWLNNNYFQRQMSGWPPYSTTNDKYCFSRSERSHCCQNGELWSSPTDGSEICILQLLILPIDDSRDKTSQSKRL